MTEELPHERYRREMRERFIDRRHETPWEQYRREMRELHIGLALVFIVPTLLFLLAAWMGAIR